MARGFVPKRILISVAASCRFKPGEPGPQRLHADSLKTDDELRVIAERLDAHDTADAELGVAYAYAGPEGHARRLVSCS